MEHRRKFNSNMARFLIQLVRLWEEAGSDPVVGLHHSRIAYTGRDYNYIATWGLAHTYAAGEEDSGRTSGEWTPTPRGVRFVKGRIRIAGHIVMYNNTLRRLDNSTTISIRKALGDRFNYRELMGYEE